MPPRKPLTTPKKRKKKVVFISHSSRDTAVMRRFRDVFLPQDAIQNGYELCFTSDLNPASEAVLEPGAPIWQDISDKLRRTTCFISCLSDEYFRSPWCVAEIALYKELHRKTRERTHIPLVVDTSYRGHRGSFLVEGAKVLFITRPADIDQVRSTLNTGGYVKRLTPEDDNEDWKSAFILSIQPLLWGKAEDDLGHFLSLAQKHFDHKLTSDGPLGGLVRRNEYEQIATQMARASEDRLVWTLFKSPLLVVGAYKQPKSGDGRFLMPYDRNWEEFGQTRKIRLVIFEKEEDAKDYSECSEEALERLRTRFKDTDKKWVSELSVEKLVKRRDDFNQSAEKLGGRLYFTTIKKLNAFFRGQNGVDYPALTRSSFLEFAYGDCGFSERDGVVMESGFNSEWAAVESPGRDQKHTAHFAHVTFYRDPKKPCRDAIDTDKGWYKKAYGHLEDLRALGDAVCQAAPDENTFVKYADIQNLWES